MASRWPTHWRESLADVDDEVPYGMTSINYVTQYGVQVTHGMVMLGLKTSNPTYEPPLGYIYGLEAEQAIELGKFLQLHGEELKAQQSG